MLREIIAITGKPGLFKMVGHGNRRIIVEDVTSKKRFPALERDKIVSLADIAMYTQGEDKPLNEILDLVYAKNNGKVIDTKQLAADGKLKDAFGEILPDFDSDRVHDSDIKKLFSWYNLLVNAGFIKFTKEEEPKEEEKPEEESAPIEKPEEESAPVEKPVEKEEKPKSKTASKSEAKPKKAPAKSKKKTEEKK